MEDWVGEMLHGVYDPFVDGSDERECAQKYVRAAHRIYEKIFASIDEILPEATELIIVPDGVLGYVPFDALLVEAPEAAQNFGSHHYRLKDHQISYTYSATLLKEMRYRKHRKTPSKNVLAFYGQEDSLENEWLYNRELYDLRLNADMVVLSACETGIGELQRGEGIISLARGFSYAGAKSIITTLWSVNDNSTKRLMENFYGGLKSGQSKDAALRNAKLDFIENSGGIGVGPYFWAGIIPVGDMNPVEFGSIWKDRWVYGLAGLAILVFLFRYFMKNRYF